MIILGIESTCDETATAIVRDGREILANVVSSSVDLHKKYKGVVPEVAAREQVRMIIPVIKECLSSMVNRSSINDLRQTINAIDAIAVAYGPGLIGSLLVGVETVKTLALVLNKPLVPVNHLIGHVYANWLEPRQSLIVDRSSKENDELYAINDTPAFPLVALIVSGGHTDLILMSSHGKFRWLGGTRDDAAGEAFDKVARVLGLGYPGGPEVERAARQFKFQIGPVFLRKANFKLPRPMISAKGGSGEFDFSFSGLKTAVANLVLSDEFVVHSKEEIAYEFQQAIVDVLVTKTVRAAKKFRVKSIVVGGGVAANERLRSQLTVHGSQLEIPVFFPSRDLSVDNGAMIAAAAFYNFKPAKAEKLQANPGLYF